VRATCPAHLILDFITRTMFGEQYSVMSTHKKPVRNFSFSPTQPPRPHPPHPLWLYLKSIWWGARTVRLLVMQSSALSLISIFRRVLNVVFFLLGNSPSLKFICRRFGTHCSIFKGG
jgi:hypothetical protein